MQPEKVSNMMLFCALIMVKNARATLQQSVNLVELSGGSKNLAEKLGMPRIACAETAYQETSILSEYGLPSSTA